MARIRLSSPSSTFFAPSLGLGGNRHADFRQGAAVGMPDARRREAVVRLQVQVEHGRMGVLAAGVREADADMGLERALVRGEPRVAVYPEERAACGALVGDEVRG